MRNSMKESGITWIGNVPSHWQVIPQKYVMHKEKQLCEHYNGEDIISLSMKGVVRRDLSAGGKMPTTFDGYQYVAPGELLMCLFDIDVTPRCIGLVRDYGVTSPAYSKFVVHKGYHNAYYDFLLRMIDDGKVFVHLAKNLRSSLTETDFGAIYTIAPPLDEQIEIASYLEKTCSELDILIDETKKSIGEYKKLKQAVISTAVMEGVRDKREMKSCRVEWLSEIPKDWDLIKIKWLLGERKDRSVDGNEEPLSMSQKFGLIPTKDMDRVPNMASSFVGAKLVKVGDLVFNKLKAHLGVFAVSQYDGLVSPDYAVYYPTGHANMKFLEYLFKTPQYIAEFKKKSSGVGAGLTRLYTGDLFSIYCALPSLDEQEEIVQYLEKKCTEMDTLIIKKEQIVSELEQYKKSLIYEYVTGKKEVPTNVGSNR